MTYGFLQNHRQRGGFLCYNALMSIITAQHLFKTFTSGTDAKVKIKALDDLSINVRDGEILGILGPNGAGKTTFLNTLSTLLIPDRGTITIAGIESNQRNFKQIRSMINMTSGYPNLPWSLSVDENLRFYGRLYGLSGQTLNNKVAELIKMFELTSFQGRRFDELSSGNKQRLALAKSLLNDPKIIFLDEPTVGLDPDVSIKMRAIIRDILKAKGVTVLLTTHNMAEAETMCERVAFIKGGKILRLASPQDLKKSQNTDDLEEVFVQLASSPLIEGSLPAGRQGARGGIEYDENLVITPLPNPCLIGRQAPHQGEGGTIHSWLNRCLAFAIRNYLFAVRNFFAFVELLFWPMVSLISIGLMGHYLGLKEGTLNFIMSGAIAAGVLQVTQLDVAYSLLYEVWSKSLKQTMLTPVGVVENLFGSWVIGIVRGAVIFGVLTLSAIFMFHYQFPSVLVTVLFMLGMFMCAFLLGLLVTVLILCFGQKAEITAWMFAYLFMLICGIYYPVDVLPGFFKVIAQLIPITYFLESFRNSQITQALIGFGLVIIYFVLGLQLLRFSYQRARRKGTIIRLSE